MIDGALNSPELEIAGRQFVPVQNTTFEQDLFIMEHIRASGIENISLEANSDQLEKVAEDLVMKAYRSGQLFLIIAGILEEKDVSWTPDEAEKNAVFFGSLRDPKDKAALQGSIVAVILSFFIEGEDSFSLSPKSSSEKPSKKQLQKGQRDQEAIVAVGTLESGT